MTTCCEALVIGIGNLLWADEGFGVRAVETLHARYAYPDDVRLVDGGTQGLYLYDLIVSARRVLVLDAIDFGLPAGALKIVRDAAVPSWSARRMSPHQNGFNDVLALAHLRNEAPDKVTLIGVQPKVLEDFGGSMSPKVRARIPEAVALAAGELIAWGFLGRRRARSAVVEPLNAAALALDVYETGRPSEEVACRIGDPRVLEQAQRRS